jgi:hypothetical protein
VAAAACHKLGFFFLLEISPVEEEEKKRREVVSGSDRCDAAA